MMNLIYIKQESSVVIIKVNKNIYNKMIKYYNNNIWINNMIIYLEALLRIKIRNLSHLWSWFAS